MGDTKECPYCAETIKAAAIKCRYCSSDLSMLPAPTPAAAVDQGGYHPVEGVDTVSGYGDELVRLTGGGSIFARLRHGGSGNFAVWTVTEDGFQSDLLVNTIGRYEGTRGGGLDGTPIAALQIEADGPWQLDLLDWSGLRRWNDSHITGQGDELLVLPGPVQGLVAATFECAGHGNVCVWADGSQGAELLVNEIGPYRGQVRVPPGTELITLENEGPWAAVMG